MKAGERDIGSFIELRNLGRTFGQKAAVDDLCLELKRGELFVLLGPSGCGKTTTLRLMAGLESPSSGDIFLNGKSLNGLPPRDRNVAMVFQEHTLYPHMRIEENLGFSLKMQRLPGKEIKTQVMEIAGVLGLEEQLKLWPHQLSGGEAQRVALGKALIRKPDLLLLDEPLSSLDPPLRRRLREEIRRLQRQYSITTVYVTHDQEEAMALGGRMGIMNHGRLLQAGAPKEIYDSPNCLFAAQFLGSPPINLIAGVLDTSEECIHWKVGEERIPCPGCGSGKSQGERIDVWVAIRPEHILVSRRSKSPPELTGTMEFVQDMGFEQHLLVSCGGSSLRARCARLPGGIEEGVGVYLKINTDKMLLFRQDTGERVVPAGPP